MPAWRTGSEDQEVLYNMEGFLEEVTLSPTLRNKTIVIRGEGDVGAGKAFRAAGDTDTLVPAPPKTGARWSPTLPHPPVQQEPSSVLPFTKPATQTSEDPFISRFWL